ncbi:hypothetical protein PGTUg99_017960 [Puccinia graminis f. sp. tritici]|uniref:Uncharacterized protein n=1 Tax=Puccinia graminis f. sp. tritici TaxID=56615 RepID=A0A5B0RXB3_PUCGR|nr:hypothetical protein PGTUg99_017960 [Puccinia graminis f. sp. tritici]
MEFGFLVFLVVLLIKGGSVDGVLNDLRPWECNTPYGYCGFKYSDESGSDVEPDFYLYAASKGSGATTWACVNTETGIRELIRLCCSKRLDVKLKPLKKDESTKVTKGNVTLAGCQSCQPLV